MPRSVTRLGGMRVNGTDGHIGRTQGVFFDDLSWSLRYLVVLTDDSIDGRQILVAPPDVRVIDEERGVILVDFSRLKAARFPEISSDPPVSLQKERDLERSMVFLPSWGTGGLWGHGVLPLYAAGGPRTESSPGRRDDPHLRSSSEVLRYRVRARDGRVGRLRDLIFDDVDWLIRHVEIGVRRGFSENRILIPPLAVVGISWRRRLVLVPVPRRMVLDAPPDTAEPAPLGRWEPDLRAP